MPRENAVAVLQQVAWYYQPCDRADFVDDLFFFGSHKWDSASILIVSSRLNGQDLRVVDVSSFDEANAWHTAFADCLQRDKFGQ